MSCNASCINTCVNRFGRNPMTTMAPPRTAERHERHVRPERDVRRGCRVRLATGPAAPAEARRRVRDAIRSCRLPVDVHDTSRSLPAVAEVPADAETGRGLLLVETLSDEWGFYRTPVGKA